MGQHEALNEKGLRLLQRCTGRMCRQHEALNEKGLRRRLFSFSAASACQHEALNEKGLRLYYGRERPYVAVSMKP